MEAIDFNCEDEVNLAVHIQRIRKEERLMEAADTVTRGGVTVLEVKTLQALAHLAPPCLDRSERKNSVTRIRVRY